MFKGVVRGSNEISRFHVSLWTLVSNIFGGLAFLFAPVLFRLFS